MFCTGQTNTMIDKLHERVLRTVFNDYNIEKEYPDFGKKYHDYIYLWVKFLI